MKLATLCYVRQSAKTLMIHRVKKENDIHEGKWNGLGGKLEPGESPEECVIREVLEESGLRATRIHFKGFLTFPLFARNEDWYAFVFVVDAFDGDLIDSPEGNLEWIDDDRLLSLNLWEGDRLFLPLLDQPGLFSGKIVYQDGRLVSHQLEIYHP
jgi:8-oxo-dGTP diphosphatase